MAGTRIEAEVDWTAKGRQEGYLRVPHSTHDSAYGWIGVPVTVLANGEGQTLLLTAGVHGDEYEGQIAVSRLARELDPARLRGRLIALPATNAPAAAAGRRVSPLDGGNLNRAFPGDPDAGPTAMIAHYLETVLIPMADTLVDLHSGGSSLVYPPTLLRGQGADAAEAGRIAALQAAMDLPVAWVFRGGGGRGSTARTAMGAANRAGVSCVMAELGGGGGVSIDALRRAERGLGRILHALDMLDGPAPGPAEGTREMHVEATVAAREAGVLEPLKDLLDPVAEGEALALVHRPDRPGVAPFPVVSPAGGVVLCRRAMGRVEVGDAVAQVARDAS